MEVPLLLGTEKIRLDNGECVWECEEIPPFQMKNPILVWLRLA
jgi:hypothetical protein